MKQVKFIDKENNVIHGGILTDDGDIICECCEGVIPVDEIGPSEDHEILKIYFDWINLDEWILENETLPIEN